MTLLEFIELIQKKWLTIIVVTAATVIATAAIHLQSPATYRTTLLYSVGISTTAEVNDSFDFTKTGDDFSRTIAGWTLSPDFGQQIGALAGTTVSASAAPQAKQNFLLSLSYTQLNLADRIRAAAEQVLTDKITKYNQNSKIKVVATQLGVSTADTKPSLITALVAAGLGGLFLALVYLALVATLSGRKK